MLLCKEIIPWSWAFLKEVPLASAWSECLFLEHPAPGELPYIETSLPIKFICPFGILEPNNCVVWCSYGLFFLPVFNKFWIGMLLVCP
jgi:hypothetical protein